jgi:hypothetical protein
MECAAARVAILRAMSIPEATCAFVGRAVEGMIPLIALTSRDDWGAPVLEDRFNARVA